MYPAVVRVVHVPVLDDTEEPVSHSKCGCVPMCVLMVCTQTHTHDTHMHTGVLTLASTARLPCQPCGLEVEVLDYALRVEDVESQRRKGAAVGGLIQLEGIKLPLARVGQRCVDLRVGRKEKSSKAVIECQWVRNAERSGTHVQKDEPRHGIPNLLTSSNTGRHVHKHTTIPTHLHHDRHSAGIGEVVRLLRSERREVA